MATKTIDLDDIKGKHGMAALWALMGYSHKDKIVELKNRYDAWRWINSHGLESRSLKSLAGVLDVKLGSEEAAKVFRVTPRTLQRKETRVTLKARDATLVFRIAEVILMAIDTFGEPEKAIRWLHKPCRALNNETPLYMLGDDVGRGLVEDTLGQIKYGIYA